MSERNDLIGFMAIYTMNDEFPVRIKIDNRFRGFDTKKQAGSFYS